MHYTHLSSLSLTISDSWIRCTYFGAFRIPWTGARQRSAPPDNPVGEWKLPLNQELSVLKPYWTICNPLSLSLNLADFFLCSEHQVIFLLFFPLRLYLNFKMTTADKTKHRYYFSLRYWHLVSGAFVQPLHVSTRKINESVINILRLWSCECLHVTSPSLVSHS